VRQSRGRFSALLSDALAVMRANPLSQQIPDSQTAGRPSRSKRLPAILICLRKLCFLAGLCGLFILGAPQLLDVVLRVHVRKVGRELAAMPESQAFQMIADLEELGPAGITAIARGLLHPEPEVAEFAARVLWEKVFAARRSAQAAAQADAAVAGILGLWPEIPADRRHKVRRILRDYLEGLSPGSGTSAQLAVQCAAILQDLPPDPLLAEEPASESPTALSQVSQNKAAEDQKPVANPLRAPRSNAHSPLAVVSGEKPPAAAKGFREGFQLTHYETESGMTPDSPVSGPIPTSGGRSHQDARTFGRLPEETALSFGPGQMPPTLRIPDRAQPLSASQEQPRQQVAQDMEASPPSGTTVSPPGLELPGASSLQDTRDGSAEAAVGIGHLRDNPWQRDRALWSQFAAGGPDAAKAQERLRELGWIPQAFLVGRLAFHPNPEERRQAVSAIWDTTGLDPLPLLMLLACDPDETVRFEALSALGTMSAPEALSLIRTMAAQDPDFRVRALANEILSRAR